VLGASFSAQEHHLIDISKVQNNSNTTLKVQCLR
jgi:hypothetical protein